MLNDTVMIIACPACATRYVVPDSAIGVDGRTVRCAKCRHSWFQDGPTIATPPATQEPPLAPPPAAPVMAAEPENSPSGMSPPASSAPADQEASPIEEPAAEPPSPVTPEPPAPNEETVAPPPVYGDPAYAEPFGEDQSSFAHEPPFKPRRNPARMWTIAAVLFAVVAFGLVGATAWYGLPDWVPLARPTFAEGQPGLKLDFPARRQDRHQLPNGTWFFGASGTVTNVSQNSRSVPPILIVLRDGQGRIVYSWEVAPPKRVLAPGESVSINEAVTDVPKSAVRAEFGWKPG